MQIQINYLGDDRHDADTTTRATRFEQALRARLAQDFGQGIVGLITTNPANPADVATSVTEAGKQ